MTVLFLHGPPLHFFIKALASLTVRLRAVSLWRGLHLPSVAIIQIKQAFLPTSQNSNGLAQAATLGFSNTYRILPAQPGGAVVKNSPVNAGDTGLILWSERSPENGNGKPLLCSSLGNPRDRGAWWATVHGVSKN